MCLCTCVGPVCLCFSAGAPPLPCWLCPSRFVVVPAPGVAWDASSIDLGSESNYVCLHSPPEGSLMLADTISFRPHPATLHIIPFVVEKRSPFRGMGQLRAPHQRGLLRQADPRAQPVQGEAGAREPARLTLCIGLGRLLGEIPRSADQLWFIQYAGASPMELLSP